MGLIGIQSKVKDTTTGFLKKAKDHRIYRNAVKKYAKQGVSALKEATPKDSGKTADSWDYEIIESKGTVKINWFNKNIVDGVNIAIILQYGHMTGNGYYVKGTDYINPALKPIFNDIANSAWKEIIKL